MRMTRHQDCHPTLRSARSPPKEGGGGGGYGFGLTTSWGPLAEEERKSARRVRPCTKHAAHTTLQGGRG